MRVLGFLWLVACCVCPKVGFAQQAAAAPAVPMHPLAQALTLESGATCLEHDKLVRRVARWLNRDVVEVPIRVRVRGSDEHPNSLSFVIDRGDGKRAERTIVDAPSECDQFHSAVALSIALAIDASDAQANGETQAQAELPDDEALLAPQGKPSPPYFRLALAAFGHATSGVLTDVTWGGSGRVEVGFWPWLDLRVGALMTSVSDQSLDGVDLDQARFSVALLAARLDACVAQTLAQQFRAVACLGGLGGRLETQGAGSRLQAFTESSLWLAGGGSVEAQAELVSWLALAVSLELAVPLIGHRVELQGQDGDREGRPRELLPAGILIGIGAIVRIF